MTPKYGGSGWLAVARSVSKRHTHEQASSITPAGRAGQRSTTRQTARRHTKLHSYEHPSTPTATPQRAQAGQLQSQVSFLDH
eukprot:861002-Pleurochrysis_carterae.AAC.2